MKVLFTTGVITPYHAAILNEIVQNGIEVTVAYAGNKSGIVGKGVKVHSDAVRFRTTMFVEKSSWYGKTKISDFIALLERESPDIVVCIWPYFLSLFFDRSLFRYMKKNNIRCVISEIPFQVSKYGDWNHFRQNPVYDENMNITSRGVGFYVRAWLLMQIRKYIYSRIDGSLNYISDAVDIISSYGLPKEKIFVTYNTTDTDELERSQADIAQLPSLLSKKMRLIHIGRLVKWKRVDMLLDAFVDVLRDYPETELLIVGDGPELDSLMKQADCLGIAQNVVFAGKVYDALTLGRYMTESSIYILAGMGGLSINDAMCYGLPVICSVCDGTEKDLVTDGVNGYFFRDGDKDDLAEKIRRLLSDPNKIKTFGAASRNVIADRINIHTVPQLYVNAFKKIVQ